MSPKPRSFVNRNLVAIVMIPTIVAIHWACNWIQSNEYLIKESERKELPIFIVSLFIEVMCAKFDIFIRKY